MICFASSKAFENFPGTAPAYGLRRARAPAPLYLPAVSNLFLQFANHFKSFKNRELLQLELCEDAIQKNNRIFKCSIGRS